MIIKKIERISYIIVKIENTKRMGLSRKGGEGGSIIMVFKLHI